MKKKYVKPEAEYIALEAEDIITDNIIDAKPGAGSALGDFGYEE